MIFANFLFPVFGLIGLGYVCRRTNWFSHSDIQGLMNFVQRIAIPFLLFRNFAIAQLPSQFPLALLASYYVPAALSMIAGFAAARLLFRQPVPEAFVAGVASGFSNTALIGIPLVLLVFGERASFPLALILTLHGSLWLSFCYMTVGVSMRASAFLPQLLSILRNPIIIGVCAGIAWNLILGKIQGSFAQFSGFLADATAGCALFGMGGMLVRYKMRKAFAPSCAIASVKLALFPFLVWMGGRYVFHTDALETAVATVLAGIPSGISCWVIAEYYNRDASTASATVLLTAILSLLTLTVVVSKSLALAGGA